MVNYRLAAFKRQPTDRRSGIDLHAAFTRVLADLPSSGRCVLTWFSHSRFDRKNRPSNRRETLLFDAAAVNLASLNPLYMRDIFDT